MEIQRYASPDVHRDKGVSERVMKLASDPQALVLSTPSSRLVAFTALALLLFVSRGAQCLAGADRVTEGKRGKREWYAHSDRTNVEGPETCDREELKGHQSRRGPASIKRRVAEDHAGRQSGQRRQRRSRRQPSGKAVAAARA
jgi:hypothetical protein